jgi:hypothetical protein
MRKTMRRINAAREHTNSVSRAIIANPNWSAATRQKGLLVDHSHPNE